MFAVYQIIHKDGASRFETHLAEASVPWLNEVLVLFTVALQLCQQLKDKVGNGVLSVTVEIFQIYRIIRVFK